MNQELLQQLQNLNATFNKGYFEIQNQTVSSKSIASQLGDINSSIDKLNNNFITFQSSLVNQPWFQFVIGSLVTLFVTFVYEWRKERKKSFEHWYKVLTEQHVFYTPNNLIDRARMTSFAGTTMRDGIVTETQEKPLSEKSVIALRSYIGWWKIPKGRLWYLFRKYEKNLSMIPDISNLNELRETKEHKRTVATYEKIKKQLFKVTGENEWTA